MNWHTSIFHRFPSFNHSKTKQHAFFSICPRPLFSPSLDIRRIGKSTVLFEAGTKVFYFSFGLKNIRFSFHPLFFFSATVPTFYNCFTLTFPITIHFMDNADYRSQLMIHILVLINIIIKIVIVAIIVIIVIINISTTTITNINI